MSVQRAATDLFRGRADVQVVCLQYSPRRAINACEQSLADAACKQQYVLARRIGFLCFPTFVIEHRPRTLEQRESKLRAGREQSRETQFQQQPREPKIAKQSRRAKEHAQPSWR